MLPLANAFRIEQMGARPTPSFRSAEKFIRLFSFQPLQFVKEGSEAGLVSHKAELELMVISLVQVQFAGYDYVTKPIAFKPDCIPPVAFGEIYLTRQSLV